MAGRPWYATSPVGYFPSPVNKEINDEMKAEEAAYDEKIRQLIKNTRNDAERRRLLKNYFRNRGAGHFETFGSGWNKNTDPELRNLAQSMWTTLRKEARPKSNMWVPATAKQVYARMNPNRNAFKNAGNGMIINDIVSTNINNQNEPMKNLRQSNAANKKDKAFDEKIIDFITRLQDQKKQARALAVYYETRTKPLYDTFIYGFKDPMLTILGRQVGKRKEEEYKKRKRTQNTTNPTTSQQTYRAILERLEKSAKNNASQRIKNITSKLARGFLATHAGAVFAKRKYVPSDGDALFAAVVQGLSLRRRGRFLEDRALLLREATRLRASVRQYQCTGVTSDVFKGRLEQDHCALIGKPGMYGGETELLAIALITNVPIAVFDPVRSYKPTILTGGRARYTRHVPHRLYGSSETKTPPLYLVYTPGRTIRNREGSAHYDVLYDVEPDPTAVLKKVDVVDGRRKNTAAKKQTNTTKKQPPPPQIQIVQVPAPKSGGGVRAGTMLDIGGALLGGGSFETAAVVGTMALSALPLLMRGMR